MSDEDKDSKSEQPTEKKISDTLEKGNVPFSREVTNAASMLGIIFISYMSVPWFFSELSYGLSGVFANVGNWPMDTPENVTNLLKSVGGTVAYLMLPIILPLIFFGLVSALSQNRPRLVLDRIAPKLNKISLMKGLKRLLGKQGVREFGKAMFKFSAAGIVATIIAFSSYDQVISQIMVDTINIPHNIHSLFLKVVTGIFFLMLILAAADFIWVRRDWVDEIKMSHQEIKDERKQAEGDPMVKLRSRSVAQDRSRRRMIKDVENATVVVTNPTHFAVAMRYDPSIDKAPFVLAKGQDRIALKIREVAEANDIPIEEDPPLARAMYKVAQVDREIPPEFFVPLANIIRALTKKNAGQHG